MKNLLIVAEKNTAKLSDFANKINFFDKVEVSDKLNSGAEYTAIFIDNPENISEIVDKLKGKGFSIAITAYTDKPDEKTCSDGLGELGYSFEDGM